MYNDTFIEDSVKRKIPKVTKIYNGILIGFTVLMVLCFFLVDYRIFGLPLLVVIAVTYMMVKGAKKEFEYSYVNGELDFFRITRQTKRTELLSVNMKDVVVVARSKTEPVQEYIGRDMYTLDLTSHEEDVVYYTMIAKVGEHKQDEAKILFEPSEELLEAMRKAAPSKVYVDAF